MPEVEFLGMSAEWMRAVRERRRAEFGDGDRVVLESLEPGGFDDSPSLPLGTEGTVYAIGEVTDSVGSLYVHWDNGSTLNATAGDRVRKL